MMQELQKLYADIPVPPNLKEDILTYCRTAEEKPKPFIVRYAKPLALAAACVAVLTVSLAATGYLGGGGNNNLPVGVPETSSPESGGLQEELTPESASTTRRTMMTTTHTRTTTMGATTTTERLDGTGGDQNSCEKHVMFYHGIDGNLIDYVGSAEVQAYLEEYGIVNTVHLTKEEREQYNIVHFLKHFGITKQEFIVAMQWEIILDEKPDAEKIGFGYYNVQYTYREMADALYSDVQVLINQVFAYEPPSGMSTSTTIADPSATVTWTR